MSLDELLVEAGAELDRLSAAHDTARPAPSGRSRGWIAVAASLVLVAIVGSVAIATRDDESISVVTTPTEPGQTEPSPTDTGVEPTTTETTATAVADDSRLTRTLFKGLVGDDVARLEERLAELGFEVGDRDGVFDAALQQAVWGYKKLVLDISPEALDASQDATAVTPQTWDSMIQPHLIEPRRPTGVGTTHVEIYLPMQVLVVFADDEPALIAHISSGELDANGEPIQYCETGTYDTDVDGVQLDHPVEQSVCAFSKTPGGVFEVTRKYEGRRVGPLGGMYDPVYFNYGLAVHGAENVPTHRASHGAVRVNNTVAEHFFQLVDKGDAVYVWGEDGKEPELYTRAESLPSFNQPPDATATTAAA
jgi:hypothetical protein